MTQPNSAIAGRVSAPSPAVRRRWYKSAAPPRPRLRVTASATAASLVALGVLAGLTKATHLVLLIAPMAATMTLIAGGPHLALSQPRNVVGGQIASATVGVVVGHVIHDALWGGAVAGAIALGAMQLLRMAHSPAAATAVIGVSTTSAPWQFVCLVAVAAAVLVAVGWVGNRLNSAKYPAYWW